MAIEFVKWLLLEILPNKQKEAALQRRSHAELSWRERQTARFATKSFQFDDKEI